MSDAIKVPGIILAMHKVMSEVRGVDKDRKNDKHGYKYTGHDDVSWVLSQAFVRHGIVQGVSVKEYERHDSELLTVRVQVTWTCIEDGTAVVVDTLGEAGMYKGEMHSLQYGKAVSYAVKMAQLKNFMLIGGAPDPEQDHGRAEPAQAPVRVNAEPVARAPEQQAQAQNQLDLLLAEYKSVKDYAGLVELRRAADSLVNTLNDDEYEKLVAADRAAEAEVGGPPAQA